MRRLGATVAVTMLLAFTFAGPAEAARPVTPVVTAVTITETGGTWPNCQQTATLEYTAGHAPGTVAVWPYLERGSTGYYWARVRGSGTVEIAITGEDYAQTIAWQRNGWFWVIQTGSLRTMPANRSITSAYDFRGACPAPGTILASGTLPLPWP